MGGRVEPLGPLGQGLLGPSGITVVGQLKQGLVSIAPKRLVIHKEWEHTSFRIA
jgi:hypothetical protein